MESLLTKAWDHQRVVFEVEREVTTVCVGHLWHEDKHVDIVWINTRDKVRMEIGAAFLYSSDRERGLMKRLAFVYPDSNDCLLALMNDVDGELVRFHKDVPEEMKARGVHEFKVLSEHDEFTELGFEGGRDETSRILDSLLCDLQMERMFSKLVAMGLGSPESGFCSFLTEGVYDPRILIGIAAFAYSSHGKGERKRNRN